jgi:hypothetical protein
MLKLCVAQGFNGKLQQSEHPVAHGLPGEFKCCRALAFRCVRRVGIASMNLYRASRPIGALFGCRAVANGDDDVHLWHVRGPTNSSRDLLR